LAAKNTWWRAFANKRKTAFFNRFFAGTKPSDACTKQFIAPGVQLSVDMLAYVIGSPVGV
jgi:hypothetical protein